MGKCFDKRRNLASGISFSGGSLGTLVMAHVMAHSIAVYSIRGALIILAGMWLHTEIIGAVLRPVSTDTRESIIGISEPQAQTPCIEIGDTSKDDNVKSNTTLPVSCVADSSNTVAVTEEVPYNETNNRTTTMDDDPGILERTHLMTANAVIHLSDSSNSTNETPVSVQTKFITEQSGISEGLNADMDLCQSEIFAEKCDVEKGIDNARKGNSCDVSIKSSAVKAAREYCAFLNNANLIVTLLALSCGFLAYYGTIVALAPYMEELGMSHVQTAWFMTMFGGIEIFCRIFVAWIIDHFHIPPSLMLKISYLILGVASQIVIFVPSYATFLCYACVLGPFAGLATVVMTSLLCACAGVAHLGSSMGLCVMLHNIMASLTSGIAGRYNIFFISNIFIQGISNQWNCSTLEPSLQHKIILHFINRQITYQHKIKVIP